MAPAALCISPLTLAGLLCSVELLRMYVIISVYRNFTKNSHKNTQGDTQSFVDLSLIYVVWLSKKCSLQFI